MTDAGPAPVRRYRAFISYSHIDHVFANRLHARLEGYRLPRGIAGERHLRPLFIDRAELSAGNNLSNKVQDALAASDALIVVASPAARASRWVTREIELFRQLHPDRPMLVALLSGEPAESLPDILVDAAGTGAEPIAADFRKGRDGRRLGLLKLVAGLADQPLDRLVQRDAQVRQRRVIAVTVAAAVLSMVLMALLVLAMRARAEAEAQRAEAEGMVEFMLTDLRSRLKGVGSLRTMQSVNARAMAYYAAQDTDDLPDTSLERRARLLHAMGEDEERLGDYAGALGKYRESQRLTAAILARSPRDASAIYAHGQSEFYVGAAALSTRDFATSETHWRAYLDLARRLAKIEPDTTRSLMELGYATGNLCDLNLRRGRATDGLPFCEEADGHMWRAVARDPGNPENALALANRLGWHADALLDLKRIDEALALREGEAAILRRLLAADPDNASLQDRQTWPMIGSGKALAAAGRHAEALAWLADADRRLSALSARQADDVTLTEQLMRVLWLEAASARALGRPVAPLDARARALHTKLRRTHTPAQMHRFDRFLNDIQQGGVQHA